MREDCEDEERIVKDAREEAILPTNTVDAGHSRRTSRTGDIWERDEMVHSCFADGGLFSRGVSQSTLKRGAKNEFLYCGANHGMIDGTFHLGVLYISSRGGLLMWRKPRWS